MILKVTLLIASISHILCGISDCLLGYSPKGKLDLKEITVIPVLGINEIIYRLTDRKYKKAYNITLILLLISALIFAILRNFPQFSFLAPIEY